MMTLGPLGNPGSSPSWGPDLIPSALNSLCQIRWHVHRSHELGVDIFGGSYSGDYTLRIFLKNHSETLSIPHLSPCPNLAILNTQRGPSSFDLPFPHSPLSIPSSLALTTSRKPSLMPFFPPCSLRALHISQTPFSQQGTSRCLISLSPRQAQPEQAALATVPILSL